MRKAFAAAGILLALSTQSPAGELRIDLAKCFNSKANFGQPVGLKAGNSSAAVRLRKFNLPDPAKTDNLWVGTRGGSIEIRLGVTGVTAVYTLLNTYYGQDKVANATVLLKGSNDARRSFALAGNKTIRDFNNWIFTNTIDNAVAQEWWTSNKAPVPRDQTKRIDAQKLVPGTAFAGQTLTRIHVIAPRTAAFNVMQPILFAINVVYSGNAGPKPVCVRHDPS